MWFAIGLVTLAGAAVASGYRRLHRGELPESGRGFRYELERQKGTLQRVRVSVAAPPGVAFECKRESRFDEWCKRIGLVREMQSGNPRFDRWVYVLSDDPAFRTALATSLADPMVRLFVDHDPDASNYVLEKFVCRDGRLLADFKARNDDDDRRATQFASRTAKGLADISGALPQAMGARRFVDPLLFRSILVLALSTGLAINGVMQGARVLWSTSAWIYDLARLWAFGFAVGGVLVVAMMAAAVALLGRTARLHLVLAEVCLVGAFGAVTTSFVELREAVIEFEAAPPTTVETRIIDKHISKGRRSTTYYVTLADWNELGREVRLDVSYSDYDAAVLGPATVRQHSGLFGIRWVDDVRPK